MKLFKAINKKRQIKGLIEQVKDNVIQLKSGENIFEIPLDVVNKANLVS